MVGRRIAGTRTRPELTTSSSRRATSVALGSLALWAEEDETLGAARDVSRRSARA
jgi:hypothetical protein